MSATCTGCPRGVPPASQLVSACEHVMVTHRSGHPQAVLRPSDRAEQLAGDSQAPHPPFSPPPPLPPLGSTRWEHTPELAPSLSGRRRPHTPRRGIGAQLRRGGGSCSSGLPPPSHVCTQAHVTQQQQQQQ